MIVCKPMPDEVKEYILKYFSYHDGVIRRADRRGGTGSLDKDGYLILKIKGKQYKAHRIAWLLCKGDYPTEEIDHIDRNRTNNRIENLRLSNRFEQVDNSTIQPNKDTGVVGIYIDRCTKGLKKKYTYRVGKKTYRAYTLEQAKEEKNARKTMYRAEHIESAKGAV